MDKFKKQQRLEKKTIADMGKAKFNTNFDEDVKKRRKKSKKKKQIKLIG